MLCRGKARSLVGRARPGPSCGGNIVPSRLIARRSNRSGIPAEFPNALSGSPEFQMVDGWEEEVAGWDDAGMEAYEQENSVMMNIAY